jgi:hypothetical protein
MGTTTFGARLALTVQEPKDINAGSPLAFQGKEKAIGSIAYYWPRLEALRDATEREIM